MSSTGPLAAENVLTINGGSSSIRFAVYRVGDPPERKISGKVERIGLPGTELTLADGTRFDFASSTFQTAIPEFLKHLARIVEPDSLRAIGHRVVHGGPHYLEHQPITPEMLAELRRISPFDPAHLPAEIALIEAFLTAYPNHLQVACFDTAFHRDLPTVARLLPIPRKYEALGVRRYGFHGLSYTFLMEELGRFDPDAGKGRVILAHLGNGASMAAVRDGKCLDTTMAFTPAAGLPMSTRSGDLDPGLVGFLARSEGMTAAQFHAMIFQQSGLLGVSEISSDMRDLLEKEAADSRAAEAVNLFCYEVKKRIGAYAAVLGGLDAVVFSGGIGENSPQVRSRIVEGLSFLGIALDEARNESNEPIISTPSSPVRLRVIRTDEEIVIAREAIRQLNC